MHIKIIDGQPVKYNIKNLRKDYPNTSFPDALTDELLASHGVYPLLLVRSPSVQDGYQKAVEGAPELVDGVWQQSWQVVQTTPEEVATWKAIQDAQAQQQKKAARTEAVSRIRVTTASGKTFDGDETSQTRMARAVVALQAAGQAETLWVLADNTPATVSLDELAEALTLAGAEQTRLWVSA